MGKAGPRRRPETLSGMKRFLRALFRPDWRCLSCGDEIFSEGKYFCPRCEEKLPYHTVICDHCGRAVPVAQSYCYECKNQLTEVDRARSAFSYEPPVSRAHSVLQVPQQALSRGGVRFRAGAGVFFAVRSLRSHGIRAHDAPAGTGSAATIRPLFWRANCPRASAFPSRRRRSSRSGIRRARPTCRRRNGGKTSSAASAFIKEKK